MAVHDEVETKYDVDDAFELPAVAELLVGIGSDDASADDAAPAQLEHGGVDRWDLEATYFDTADFRLLASGLTLRRRIGGPDDGWTLKVPVGAGTRREVTAALGRSSTTAPIRLRRMVWMQTRDEPLVPVLRVSTQRAEHHLMSGEQTLADIADDRVTATRLSTEDGKPVGEQTWHELEVELVHGSRSLLERVDRQLRSWGATPSASPSKLVRGLGIQPDVGRASKAIKRSQRRQTARSTAGEVIVAYVAREVDRIRQQDLLVRLDQPDSLHTMRVATRRVRSALHTYATLFEPGRVEPLEPELKWLAGELGHARDAEVLRMRLLGAVGAEQARHLSTARVTQTVDREMARQQKATFAAVTATLDSDRYRQLVTALEELLVDPPLTGPPSMGEQTAKGGKGGKGGNASKGGKAGKGGQPAGKQLPRLVARSYERVRQSVLAGSALPSGDERDTQLHEARKAAKRARYAAEAAIPAFGKPAKAFAAAMEQLQEVLGERHDSVAMQQRLHALALEGPPALAFTYGRLHARESAHQDRVDASVAQAWKVAAKKSLRTWLA